MASLGDLARGAGRIGMGAAGMAYRGTRNVAAGTVALAATDNPDALAAGYMTAQAGRAVGAVKSGISRGIRGAYNKAFGSDTASGPSGSPARGSRSGDQPLTEKTFIDFSNKLLTYTRSLLKISERELDAMQDQELRVKEMLAEGTGKESLASRVAQKKKKSDGMGFLKMLGLGALAVALASGKGPGSEGSGEIPLPFIVPPPFLPKPKPKSGRTPPRTPPRRTPPRTTPPRTTTPKGGPRPGSPQRTPVYDPKVDRFRDEKGRFTKKPPGTEPKAGAPEKKRVNKDAIKKAAKKVVGSIAKRVLPGIGVAYGLYDAVEDANKGDLFGALRAVGIAAGSLASMVPFLAPIAVPATAAGVVADLIIDLKNDPELQGASQKDIEDAAKEVVDEYIKKLTPLTKQETAADIAEKLARAEAGKKTGERLRGRTRDMSPEERRALSEQQKKDRAEYKKAGGKKGTGVSFEKFAAGRQEVREKQIQMDIDASVEAEEAMGSSNVTPATPTTPTKKLTPAPTPKADLSPSSAATDTTNQIASYSDEGGGGVSVAGATSVNVGGEELDTASYDKNRAEETVDAKGSADARLKSLLPRSINLDPTMAKALTKSLSTTA